MHAPADRNYLSADIRGKFRGEEDTHVGNVLRGTSPAQRDGVRPGFSYSFRQLVGHIADYKPGSDGVGTDTSRSEFFGYGFCKCHKACLRGCVIGLTGISGKTDNGTHIDDVPAFLSDHQRCYGMYEIEGRFQVHLQHHIPFALPGCFEGVAEVDPPTRRRQGGGRRRWGDAFCRADTGSEDDDG